MAPYNPWWSVRASAGIPQRFALAISSSSEQAPSMKLNDEWTWRWTNEPATMSAPALVGDPGEQPRPAQPVVRQVERAPAGEHAEAAPRYVPRSVPPPPLHRPLLDHRFDRVRAPAVDERQRSSRLTVPLHRDTHLRTLAGARVRRQLRGSAHPRRAEQLGDHRTAAMDGVEQRDRLSVRVRIESFDGGVAAHMSGSFLVWGGHAGRWMASTSSPVSGPQLEYIERMFGIQRDSDTRRARSGERKEGPTGRRRDARSRGPRHRDPARAGSPRRPPAWRRPWARPRARPRARQGTAAATPGARAGSRRPRPRSGSPPRLRHAPPRAARPSRTRSSRPRTGSGGRVGRPRGCPGTPRARSAPAATAHAPACTLPHGPRPRAVPARPPTGAPRAGAAG